MKQRLAALQRVAGEPALQRSPGSHKQASSSHADNPMRRVTIEKVVVSAGATAEGLVKARKLFELLTQRKAQIIKTRKRIPDFNVRPGLEVGTRVTVRGEAALELLRRLLGAVENTLSTAQVSDNHVSFGIKEYIEIPGIEYQRDIGIRGFNTTIVFARPGLRIKHKKIKAGHVPHRQYVSPAEIIKYMEENFKTVFI